MNDRGSVLSNIIDLGCWESQWTADTFTAWRLMCRLNYSALYALISLPIDRIKKMFQIISEWDFLHFISSYHNDLVCLVKGHIYSSVVGTVLNRNGPKLNSPVILSYRHYCKFNQNPGLPVWVWTDLQSLTPQLLTWHCRDRISSCNIYAVQQDTQSDLTL